MATATYNQSVCQWARREGQPLPVKGPERSLESKCNLQVPPGMHGPRLGRPRLSDRGVQLRQKQMIRRIYLVLERQFRRCYKNASRMKGSTAENLLQILESRLDNIVYRCHFAATRAEARQLVSHKAITVNGKVINVPSYLVQPGDVVEVREKAKKQIRIKAALENTPMEGKSEWIDINPTQMQGTFKYKPTISDMPSWYNLNLIIEYYSK